MIDRTVRGLKAGKEYAKNKAGARGGQRQWDRMLAKTDIEWRKTIRKESKQDPQPHLFLTSR